VTSTSAIAAKGRGVISHEDHKYQGRDVFGMEGCHAPCYQDKTVYLHRRDQCSDVSCYAFSVGRKNLLATTLCREETCKFYAETGEEIIRSEQENEQCLYRLYLDYHGENNDSTRRVICRNSSELRFCGIVLSGAELIRCLFVCRMKFVHCRVCVKCLKTTLVRAGCYEASRCPRPAGPSRGDCNQSRCCPLPSYHDVIFSNNSTSKITTDISHLSGVVRCSVSAAAGPGQNWAEGDMYRVLSESGHLNLPPIMWCRGGGRSPSDNYNIDYGFGAISYHM
ncbi:hypothetical protein L9F63_024569, partial [Diploptera punctata]